MLLVNSSRPVSARCSIIRGSSPVSRCHEAVRLWYDGDWLYLDWDELPGKCVVQYRQSGHDE